ncbi:porin [Prochlorococcus sp. AH-736-K09]|nr:porin [Prochlorococcus sp. AH-736-K09]
MKLFQQMLVASTALSLTVPIAAQASQKMNIDGMKSYVRSEKSRPRIDSKTFVNQVNEDLANLNDRIDSLEAHQNIIEAGGFSDTTTLDGKAVFTLAAADHNGTYANDANGSSSGEALMSQYMYVMNLNTSFTGDDNLYVRLKTGNASGWTQDEEEGGYLSSSNSGQGGDVLDIDKLWYTFPVGDKHSFWVGPKIENYYMHGTTPSIYSPTLKQFTLGGNASAYGASTNSGFGYAYKLDNGLAISTNFVSQQNANATRGLLTNEAPTSWATQIGYTQPQYSVSAIVNLKYNGWADSYFGTTNGIARAGNSTNVGLRAWWRPQETGTATPSISIGADFSEIDGAAAGQGSTDMYFVGLNWADMIQADDKIGVAFGQPQAREDDTVDPFSWEAYYQYQINDSTNLRGTVFGNSDRDGTAGNDNSGVVVETTFKF